MERVIQFALGNNPIEEVGRVPVAANFLQIHISDRDPLDDIARDAPAATVVNLGGPRVRMAGEALHVFQRDGFNPRWRILLSSRTVTRHVAHVKRTRRNLILFFS
jgi:hypothetical protein